MSDPVSQRPQPLPESARARLGRAQAGKPFFTSDLSVNEFVLTTQTGFQPLGLVMGTCIYHVGIQVGAGVDRRVRLDVQAPAEVRGH